MIGPNVKGINPLLHSPHVMDVDIGDAECPCLTPEKLHELLPVAHTCLSLNHFVNIGPCIDFTPREYDFHGDQNVQLKPNLGQYCNAWDLPQAHFGMPIWLHRDFGCPRLEKDGSPTNQYDPKCFAYFCYVDPCKCDKEDLHVSAMYTASDTHQLVYSYHTCARCLSRSVIDCEQHPACHVQHSKCRYRGHDPLETVADRLIRFCGHVKDKNICNQWVSCNWDGASCLPQTREEIRKNWGCDEST